MWGREKQGQNLEGSLTIYFSFCQSGNVIFASDPASADRCSFSHHANYDVLSVAAVCFGIGVAEAGAAGAAGAVVISAIDAA